MTATHLCFIDTETTGLDPAVAELIEVAVLMTDLKAEKILDRYTVRVSPLRPENISKEAAAVNGYKPETWLPVVPHVEVLGRLKPFTKNALLAGHNTQFDLGFMKRFFKDCNERPNWDYHILDTMSLAFPMFAEGLIPNVKLKTLCEFFKIANKQEHSAEGDVEATLAVYRELRKLITLPTRTT